MENKVKLVNAQARTFNGVKAGKTIYVEANRVDFYLGNGFEKVDVIREQKLAQEQADLEALNKDLEAQADLEAQDQAQAQAQAELDADYEAKKTDDELPSIDDEDAETEDQEDQENETETTEKKEDVEVATDDLEALNKDLEAQAIETPKKGGKKSK